LLPRICHVRRPVIRLPAKHGDSLFDSDTWLQFSNLNRVLNAGRPLKVCVILMK